MKKLEDFAGSIAIVVSSCDRFFDAWRPFAFFLRRFWPDCPFPVYLIMNRLHVHSKTIRPLRTGSDKGWATNLLLALKEIQSPYILYMQEDYFLTAPVDRARLADDFTYAFDNNAASLCFADLSLLEPEFARINSGIGVVPQESKGRTRCQVTLWKREALASVLKHGESAWEMEARGNERTRGLFMLSYARNDKPPIPYLMSAISRGLWTPLALALCRENNFRIRPFFRPPDTTALHGRRFRRAIGRVTYALAFAAQLTPIDLDR